MWESANTRCVWMVTTRVWRQSKSFPKFNVKTTSWSNMETVHPGFDCLHTWLWYCAYALGVTVFTPCCDCLRIWLGGFLHKQSVPTSLPTWCVTIWGPAWSVDTIWRQPSDCHNQSFRTSLPTWCVTIWGPGLSVTIGRQPSDYHNQSVPTLLQTWSVTIWGQPGVSQFEDHSQTILQLDSPNFSRNQECWRLTAIRLSQPVCPNLAPNPECHRGQP